MEFFFNFLHPAHLAAILLNWKEDSLILRQRVRNRKVTAPTFGKIIRISRILLVGSIICVDIVTAIVRSMSDDVNTTSYTAHIAGVVMGILVGVVILKNRRVQFWQQWLRVACCIVAGTFLSVMVIINIFFVDIFPPTSYNYTEFAQYVK